MDELTQEVVSEEQVAEPIEPVKVEEPIVDNSVDENGVPWKNRAMEAKRKQDELERKLVEERQRLSSEENWAKREAETGLDRNTLKAVDTIASDRIKEELSIERNADRFVRTTLNNLETEKPILAKYRTIIESRLENIDAVGRANAMLIKTIAFSVLGENYTEPTQKAATTAKLTSVKTGVLESRGTGSPAKQVALTEAEQDFGMTYGLYDKGFTEEEIRAKHKKYLDTHKLKGE